MPFLTILGRNMRIFYIPYYCEVRFLSRGKTLKRFVELKEAIMLFLGEKDLDVPELDDPSWWQDLGFITDLCQYLNQLNLSLQGRANIVTEMMDNVKAFKKK